MYRSTKEAVSHWAAKRKGPGDSPRNLKLENEIRAPYIDDDACMLRGKEPDHTRVGRAMNQIGLTDTQKQDLAEWATTKDGVGYPPRSRRKLARVLRELGLLAPPPPVARGEKYRFTDLNTGIELEHWRILGA